MINKKSNVYMILLIIVCCILAIFTVYYKLEATKYKEMSKINHDYLNYQELTAKNDINTGFNILFNYDNSNFVSRFKELEKFMNNDVITEQKGSGEVETPQIKIVKKVNNIRIYRQVIKERNISALVEMNSTYKVKDKENPSVNELYKVKYNLTTHKISSLEYLGAINNLERP